MCALITVLLATNKHDFKTDRAILSVLSQDFSSFQLLIIANGKNSLRIKETLLSRWSDPKVKVLHTDSCNLADSLNFGLNQVLSPFIARMDDDDICFHNRLSIQYNMINSMPEINILANGYIPFLLFEGTYKLFKVVPFSSIAAKEVKLRLPFNNCICHPTVFARSEAFIFQYPRVRYGQDYCLWLNLVFRSNLKIFVSSIPVLYYSRAPTPARKAAIAYKEPALLKFCIYLDDISKFSLLLGSVYDFFKFFWAMTKCCTKKFLKIAQI